MWAGFSTRPDAEQRNHDQRDGQHGRDLRDLRLCGRSDHCGKENRGQRSHRDAKLHCMLLQHTTYFFTAASICFIASLIIAERDGSCSSEVMNFLACSNVMCGGSGGTSGSVRNETTHGRSAVSAASHAAPMRSGVSQRTPFRPSDSANCAYWNPGTS